MLRPLLAAVVSLLAAFGLTGAQSAQQDDPERILGKPATWSLEPEEAPAQDVVELPEGSQLRAEPRAGSPVIETLPAIRLPVVERRGGWLRVRYGERLGWLQVERIDEPVQPVTWVPSEPAQCVADRAYLDRARSLLGDGAREELLGPYTLHTDVASESLVRYLDRIASGVAAAYEERYGLREDAGDPCTGTVVLFADRQGYRQLTGSERGLEALDLVGNAGGGVVTLYLGALPWSKMGHHLIHELVHLLNGRRLGSPLPPWLDEGLAGDLAMSRLTRDGRLDAESIDWEGVPLPATSRGPASLIASLIDALRTSPEPLLPELTRLNQTTFMSSSRAHLYYSLSFLWVRFLLAGGDPELERGFRDFLAAVAAGELVTSDVVEGYLGKDWERLQKDFILWLERLRQRRELGIE